MPEDTIMISGLQVDCLIGTYDWEQEVQQRLLLDLELSYDMAAAAQHDDLTKAVDYAAITQQVTEFVEASHFQLVEALATSIVNLVLDEFAVRRCALTLHKPNAIPLAEDVSIRIERERD